MEKFEVNVFQLKGRTCNIGLKTGQRLHESPIIKIWSKILEQDIDDKSMYSIYSSYVPHLLEELEGLAEGLGISSIRTASLFSRAKVCTSRLGRDSRFSYKFNFCSNILP